ncbi:MAG TPA: aldehyde ferredoxin oxidoreductase, partial [candidate division Zixibacteria bacterium]|nr:aldehyde ferredoxin oxidoreductase [candidate division Zixibacteria bacterium]
SVKKEEIPEAVLRDFLGGRGLGSKYLYDELKPGTDPLSPENNLYFAANPLNGTGAATSCRYNLVTKSPLTGTILSCSAGGHFGIDLKACGYDMVAFEGRASKPCYLYLNSEKAELRDASDLWGLDTHQSTEKLLAATDPKAGAACIGPAGERGVLLASIMNEKDHAAGRGGPGAVMGSKNLKAVVASGSLKTPWRDEEAVAAAKKQWMTFLAEAPLTKDALKEWGTPVLVKVINSYGAWPTRNFQQGYFTDDDSLSAQTFKERFFVKREPCAACAIGCSRLTRTSRRQGKGPEYETIWAFGALCGVRDLEAVVHANYNCNELGLDTISAGNTIACAMELSERGLLDSGSREMIRKALGRDLRFGDPEAIVLLTEQTGKAEGFGKILGMGCRRLAERYGHPELAMHVKGLELPAYDPRGFAGMGLAMATTNRGGCHVRSFLIGCEAIATPVPVSRFTTGGKAGITKLYQDLTAVIDSIGACLFSFFALSPDHYATMLQAVTGIRRDSNELVRAGERIWNLERLFNIR